MNGPEPVVERDAEGRTTKMVLDAEVAVLSDGESIEQQAVLLFDAEERGLPVNLAEILEEHFGSGRESERRSYGRLRISIERA